MTSQPHLQIFNHTLAHNQSFNIPSIPPPPGGTPSPDLEGPLFNANASSAYTSIPRTHTHPQTPHHNHNHNHNQNQEHQASSQSTQSTTSSTSPPAPPHPRNPAPLPP
ncbi:hypothetical protein BO70DRAFT_194731 [Aspergillus heteromorphus CBS 117.55]|uniref:Uncharacterized protein n=1 Tax=Aspergillus heteromorphus CBS 117.55 TaxID=1448321 RepID=A0A317WMA0_9EURO|nr:uncharacterized protein BO70DRAFT_194731 [Aspergillus heteromorphus CBS 117.55]PWY87463.1 hypothetical protein BO70DRAFT_194731 [Aspergillus heteromorphus CBS 117.55]